MKYDWGTPATYKKGYIDKSRLFIRDDLAESIHMGIEPGLNYMGKKNQTRPDIDTDKVNIFSRSRIPFFTNFELGAFFLNLTDFKKTWAGPH